MTLYSKIKMFCDILQDFETITSFSENGDYTEKERNIVKKLNYKKFEKILQILNNQTSITNTEYAIYKMAYNNLKFEFVTQMQGYNEREYHTVIDSTDSHLILNILTPECLANFILDNDKKKYIFLTLNYGSNIHDAGHQSIIFINNSIKKIYMIDPNGRSTYFDSIFNELTNPYVEMMLSRYFSELIKFGLEYSYVDTMTWNPDTMIINKTTDNDYVGSGNCVVTALMLIHLISVHNFAPEVAFERLSKLSKEELLYLIKEYSLGIYSLMK